MRPREGNLLVETALGAIGGVRTQKGPAGAGPSADRRGRAGVGELRWVRRILRYYFYRGRRYRFGANGVAKSLLSRRLPDRV